MLAVDHGSRPLLKFVCGRVMNAVRGDRLLLVREAGQAGSQEGVTSRRLLENFSDIAGACMCQGAKAPQGFGDAMLCYHGPALRLPVF